MALMSFDDYKVVLYRHQPAGWVAEIPAIPGCHALMPDREQALVELAAVFRLISDEYEDRKQPLPADTTEIVHAWRASRRIPPDRKSRFMVAGGLDLHSFTGF